MAKLLKKPFLLLSQSSRSIITSVEVSFTTRNGSSLLLLVSKGGKFTFSSFNWSWIYPRNFCSKLVSSLKVSINDYRFISNSDPGEFKVPVFKVVINEAYDSTTKVNDIALIEVLMKLLVFRSRPSYTDFVLSWPKSFDWSLFQQTSVPSLVLVASDTMRSRQAYLVMFLDGACSK